MQRTKFDWGPEIASKKYKIGGLMHGKKSGKGISLKSRYCGRQVQKRAESTKTTGEKCISRTSVIKVSKFESKSSPRGGRGFQGKT